MPQPEHKRGDTFNYSGEVYLYEYGNRVLDLTGWVGSAQLRSSSGDLIDDLIFEWIAIEFSRVRFRSADTTNWPVRAAYIDVQLRANGDTVSSKTQKIQIVGDITRD